MIRLAICHAAVVLAALADPALAQSTVESSPTAPKTTNTQSGFAGLTTEVLYAVDSDVAGDLDQFFRISTVDGSQTLIGSTAPVQVPGGLTFDGFDMYVIDLGSTGGLYRLDLRDGTPTLVGNTGINGWQGLASDPTDSWQLYGATQADVLYRLSRTDGSATQVAALGPFGPGVFVNGLEFDANGVLWAALSDFIENEGFLSTIDKNTGQVTILGHLVPFITGIDFDSNGTLYGIERDSTLYVIDPETGAADFVGKSTGFMHGLAFSLCGNGAVDANEQCDDGNPLPCDGCSAACFIETGSCGDGVVNPDCEQCDDSNDVNDDGCRNDCTVPSCGDGIVDPGEACDDGNQISGDGCSADCAVAVPAAGGIALVAAVAVLLAGSTAAVLARRGA